MQINYLAPYLFTYLLLPLLRSNGRPKAPSRIIFVASEGHYACPSFEFSEIDHPETFINVQQQYLLSKFLIVTAAMGLSNHCKDKDIVIHSLCPGTTKTPFWDRWPRMAHVILNLGTTMGWIRTVDQAAANIILGNFETRGRVNLW
jgi:NAD(P)-dependent dehydrogenase (short-subunit alcohol dehydrogenase family)